MSLRGHLLIAPAHMADPNFARAVVLLLQHDGDGAFGVILNRPTDQSIREVWQQVQGAPCRSDEPVRAGGPVPGPLVALHGEADLGELEVLHGVWCTMSGERVANLVERAPEDLLLFAGYSGWGAGQLEAEMQAGSWLATEAKRGDLARSDLAGLWPRAFRRAAGTHPLGDLEPDPGDPRWN